jgi:hypothetical protein
MESPRDSETIRIERQSLGVVGQGDGKEANRFQYRLSHMLLGIAVFAAILTAGIAAASTYETHGAVNPGLFLFALGWLVLVFVAILVVARRLRLGACIAMIAVCFALALNQAMLTRRLEDLKQEVSHIAAFMNEFKAVHGAYPRDLSEYTFQRPELKKYIRYNESGYRQYAIGYHPLEDAGVTHLYWPESGHYYYEDD